MGARRPLAPARAERPQESAVIVRLISLASPADWDAALSRVPHGPAHTHWYNAALSLSVDDEIALMEYASPPDWAACPIVLRRHGESIDIAIPYGIGGFAICGECKELPDVIRRFAGEQRWVCGYLAVHPLSRHPFSAEDGLEWGENGLERGPLVYRLDLSMSEPHLFASMHATNRYEIRRDEALLSSVITDAAAIGRALPEIYEQTRARVGASDAYRFSRATLAAWLSSPGCLALGLGDPLQAVVICTHAAGVADYFINASTDQGRKYTRILIWAAMRELKRLGIRYFNLGGGVRDGDTLDAFKRRFGGELTVRPILKQVYCRDRFVELCAQAGAMERAGSYFPPYRQ